MQSYMLFQCTAHFPIPGKLGMSTALDEQIIQRHQVVACWPDAIFTWDSSTLRLWSMKRAHTSQGDVNLLRCEWCGPGCRCHQGVAELKLKNAATLG